MILKTVCAFLAFLLELFGLYGDGEFKWYYGYVSLVQSNAVNSLAYALFTSNAETLASFLIPIHCKEFYTKAEK